MVRLSVTLPASVHVAVVDAAVVVVQVTLPFMRAFGRESRGTGKRMMCVTPTMLLEKPSPIKHPAQRLAHGIRSTVLISPVEMVLPFFKPCLSPVF